MMLDALTLIKELTEENEKLGIKNFDLICELSRIKADTVREMQEALKERIKGVCLGEAEMCAIFDEVAGKILNGNTEDENK
jgi:hypothetical protein